MKKKKEDSIWTVTIKKPVTQMKYYEVFDTDNKVKIIKL